MSEKIVNIADSVTVGDLAEALGLPTEAAIADSYVDEQGTVDLPKIANQAYDNVMAYMANGVR